jgi:hypothetical protein
MNVRYGYLQVTGGSPAKMRIESVAWLLGIPAFSLFRWRSWEGRVTGPSLT